MSNIAHDDSELCSRLAVCNNQSAQWVLFSDLRDWMLQEVGRRLNCLTNSLAAEEVITRIEDRWERIMARFTVQVGDAQTKQANQFRAYLRRCIGRQVEDWRRSPRSRRFELPADGSEPAAPTLEFTDCDLQELRERINSLSTEDRKLIEMKFWKELTFQQIATETKRPLTTVYLAINRVIESLGRRFGTI